MKETKDKESKAVKADELLKETKDKESKATFEGDQGQGRQG